MKRLIGPLLALVLGGCVTTTAPNPAPPAAADAPPHVQLATWTSQRLPPPLTTRRPRVSSDPLDSFFQALSDLEAGRLDTVTVVQIGDSHTANDRFSGRIRELMQARFGNAGRGMLAPGNPYNGFRPTQVTVTSRGWRPIPSWPGKPGTPIGLTGFQAQADRPGDVMAVEPKDDSRFDVLGVGILRQPGGGTLVVRADGVEVARIATAGAETSTAQMRLDLDHPTRRLEL
ncbi:MAG TPA: hypothetical protein VK196_01090, partial [Magnetospirillum sp.]|nr:hypothetical protein [Magnetospirillum sp.]